VLHLRNRASEAVKQHLDDREPKRIVVLLRKFLESAMSEAAVSTVIFRHSEFSCQVLHRLCPHELTQRRVRVQRTPRRRGHAQILHASLRRRVAATTGYRPARLQRPGLRRSCALHARWLTSKPPTRSRASTSPRRSSTGIWTVRFCSTDAVRRTTSFHPPPWLNGRKLSKHIRSGL
jgi:hypothetical protein